MKVGVEEGVALYRYCSCRSVTAKHCVLMLRRSKQTTHSERSAIRLPQRKRNRKKQHDRLIKLYIKPQYVCARRWRTTLRTGLPKEYPAAASKGKAGRETQRPGKTKKVRARQRKTEKDKGRQRKTKKDEERQRKTEKDKGRQRKTKKDKGRQRKTK